MIHDESWNSKGEMRREKIKQAVGPADLEQKVMDGSVTGKGQMEEEKGQWVKGRVGERGVLFQVFLGKGWMGLVKEKGQKAGEA